MKLIVDIETNGFLEKTDLVIHCICCKDIESEKTYNYNPDELNDQLEFNVRYVGTDISDIEAKPLTKK